MKTYNSAIHRKSPSYRKNISDMMENNQKSHVVEICIGAIDMINRVFLLGNLGEDPTMRYTTSGTAVATLSVATSRKWKDKDGNMQEETEWHRVIVWAQSAEFCGNYLHKGSKVYVEGRLQTRKWQDQDGNDKYTTEIIAQTVQNLTPKGEGGQQGGYSDPPPQDPGLPFGGTGDDVPF